MTTILPLRDVSLAAIVDAVLMTLSATRTVTCCVALETPPPAAVPVTVIVVVAADDGVVHGAVQTLCAPAVAGMTVPSARRNSTFWTMFVWLDGMTVALSVAL